MIDQLTRTEFFGLLSDSPANRLSADVWNDALSRFFDSMATFTDEHTDYRQVYRVLIYTRSRLTAAMLNSCRDGKKCTVA